jgi:hypothetical protein
MPPPLVIKHCSDVLVVHIAVWHADVPIDILGVSETVPKFAPTSVIEPPPDVGALLGWLYVTTGESYVKITIPVPRSVDVLYTIDTEPVSPGGTVQ